jgi:glycosyltransferase involved in cell wall biosynthesis
VIRRVGWALARRRRRFAAARARGEVIFVSGPGGDARRYRCEHPCEALELADVEADVAYRADVELASLADRFRTIVLYRIPWDGDLARLLDRARGATVLADVDDLVFEPAAAPYLRALDALPPDERRLHEETIAGIARTLAAVEGVVVSTDPLAAAAGALNPRVAVVPNVVSAEMVRAGEAARAGADRRRPTTIAYLSGTPTHDVDFLEAAPAVLDALERFPELRFLVVGYLGLDARFDRFGDRVQRLAAVPWQRLPSVLASVDVNLAPLERDNPFTEAKSCLKYLEAAVVGVPTVASPRADFRRVIRDGENGLLAEHPEAWQRALRELLESRDLRERLGKAAREDVLERHTTTARSPAAYEAFASLAGRLGAGSVDAPSRKS